MTTVQKFETIHIPRLVRGKQGSWNPNHCLVWGAKFVSFLKTTIDKWDEHFPAESKKPSDERVWRVKFLPGKGAEVALLDKSGTEEVRNGEDRIGFLPRWYRDAVNEQSHHSKDNENTTQEDAS